MKARSVCFALVGVLALVASASAQYGIVQPGYVYNPATHYVAPTTAQYDQWGRLIVRDNSDTVHNSAYDPNRGIIDPGSYRQVNYTYRDQWGRTIQKYGTEWTSNGVPHGNITTRVIQNFGGGGGQYVNNNNTFYAPSPGGQYQNTNNQYYSGQYQNTNTTYRGGGRGGQYQNTNNRYYSRAPQ